jgi:hypothetical protein
VLNLRCAVNRVHDTGELRQHTVAGGSRHLRWAGNCPLVGRTVLL